MSASITSKGRKKNLSALINYATEAKKTAFEEELLITGIKCSGEPNEAVEEMNFARKRMNKAKKDKTQVYHVVHSFSEEATINHDPYFLHDLSVKFAEEAFPECQILVSSHVNTDHFHSHIVVNNINLATGKRIRIDPKDLENMRKINDRVLEGNGIKPIDNDYYNNLSQRRNMYSRNSKRLKNGEKNHQLTIQEAVYDVLNNKKNITFHSFADELARDYNIEVYRHSKNSKKLGYNLYKDEIDFYSNKDFYIELGKNKGSRKEKSQYILRNFSGRKLGKDFSFKGIERRLFQNEMNQQRKIKQDKKKEISLEKISKSDILDDINDSAQEINRLLNDDINMYRAKKDYEHLQRKLELERQRRSFLER